MPSSAKKATPVENEARADHAGDPIFDAITFDTNVFHANKRRLDGGLLSQFTQYRDRPIRVIISEVVAREIRKHLADLAEETHASLRKALKLGTERGHIDEEAIEALQEAKRNLISPDEIAETQLKDFLESSDAEVVSADLASTTNILDAYFEGQPPFSGEGKKHEFPDALIVSSLVNWAERNDANLLAVCKDKGWSDAARRSGRVTVDDNLGSAMNRLLAQDEQQELRRARLDARKLWSALRAGEEEYAEDAQALLRDEVEAIEADFEVSGSRHVEIDAPEVALASVVWDDAQEPEVVNADGDGFVFRVDATLTVHGRSTAEFSVYDPIDKDYVSMGSMGVEAAVTDTVSLLFDITIELDETDKGEQRRVPRINKIEILDFRPHFDYGELEVTDIPGWHDEGLEESKRGG